MFNELIFLPFKKFKFLTKKRHLTFNRQGEKRLPVANVISRIFTIYASQNKLVRFSTACISCRD